MKIHFVPKVSDSDSRRTFPTVLARTLALLLLAIFTLVRLHAANGCTTIRGRAHLYGGDGQLRIWHVGTHHDYEPDESSWSRVEGWLQAGVGRYGDNHYASPVSTVYLFADFAVCPAEPFKRGSVQRAKVLSAQNRRYVPAYVKGP